MPAVIASLRRGGCLRQIIKPKSKEDALDYCKANERAFELLFILSVSIQIKDTPLVIACIGSIRATCDKCTFMIKLKLNPTTPHRVLILKNSSLVVLSLNSEGFFIESPRARSFISSFFRRVLLNTTRRI